MRVETHLHGGGLGDVAADARQAEALGYDGLASSEVQHNHFLPLVLAAEHTRRVSLCTAVAIAFPRSPMITAYEAWDLQRFRDYIGALGAIWSCWQNGTRLGYDNGHYGLTLMTPEFSPGPNELLRAGRHDRLPHQAVIGG